MTPATDYRIYQRNKDGYAEILLAGSMPKTANETDVVRTRVCREEDNLMIIPWTECERKGDQWQIILKVPQGGLYRMESCVGSKEITPAWCERIQNVCHVGVGELYMLTGQSNMAGHGRDMAYDPPQLGVHLYGNNGKWSIATHPLNDSIDTIYPENRETTSGTSPALAFARRVWQTLHVPVGLVQASLGGSPLSRWDMADNGDLSRAMLRRLDATGPVSAILWYQGCSDTFQMETAKSYLARFKRTVKLWREKMGNIPVVTVQLSRWANENADIEWGIVREAQRQAARVIPGVYVTPAIDLANTDGIHNSSGSNVILGERMAMIYLHGEWDLPGVFAPDVEKVMRLDDTHLFIQMSQGSDVVTMGNSAQGMDAEDEEGLIPCVKAEAKDGGLLVELSRPCRKQVRFHMMWRTMPPAFQPRGRYGLPVLSCYGVEAVEA